MLSLLSKIEGEEMSLKSLQRSRGVLFAFGAFAIISGLAMSLMPGLSALTLTIIWGVYALIDGFTALFAAFKTKEGRGWFIFTGIIGILAGITVISGPLVGLASLGWVFGVWLIIRGITELIAATAPDQLIDKFLVGLAGVLWIIAGVFAVRHPAETAVSLTWLFGLLTIGWGIMLVIAGFRVKKVTDKAQKTNEATSGAKEASA